MVDAPIPRRRERKANRSAFLALGTAFGFAIGWLWLDQPWWGLVVGMLIGVLLDAVAKDF